MATELSQLQQRVIKKLQRDKSRMLDDLYNEVADLTPEEVLSDYSVKYVVINNAFDSIYRNLDWFTTPQLQYISRSRNFLKVFYQVWEEMQCQTFICAEECLTEIFDRKLGKEK
jgi:Fe2+ or Zn2+ uptake regulation protein